MKDEHEPGRCTLCFQETDVRWKNLYTIGSEGTWMCLPCEKKILRFCEQISREAAQERKYCFLKRKEAKNENG